MTLSGCLTINVVLASIARLCEWPANGAIEASGGGALSAYSCPTAVVRASPMDQLVRSEASLNKPRKQRSDFHATRPISGATGRVGFGQNGKRPIANMGYRFAHRHRQCRSCVDRD